MQHTPACRPVNPYYCQRLELNQFTCVGQATRWPDLFVALVGKLHKVSLDKAIDFAVHHAVHIARLKARAVILHAAVVKHVAAYLATPLNLLLAGLNLSLFRLALLQCIMAA